MRIAVVGGTGREGRGLALRWARAGHVVALGSRDAARGEAAGLALRAIAGQNGSVKTAAIADPSGSAEAAAIGDPAIEGGGNAWAVARAEVVVLSVPYAAHAETLRELASALAGRVLIDITVPLVPPKVSQVHLPAGQAAALEAQALVGADTPVVAALHHVSSTHLGDPDRALEGDVLVCSDSDAARATAIALIADLGARALDAGPLRNAIALEALTPVLLHLNKRYKGSGAGVRFLGI